ncbi:unnamed protein product [Callosobruchus maculatus]|uniref:Uncharacterized protein n=1 Tax=Callosobruchus maculatus TaxID=64391 RepID=A0A653CWY4_CALMS|nr:unnamed protein product [Callosobruchus maculatus]
MAGYTLQLLVFLGLICFTYQQKHYIPEDLSRYGFASQDSKPYFRDESVEEDENAEKLANVEIPRGLVSEVFRGLLSNGTGLPMPKVIGNFAKGIGSSADTVRSIVSFAGKLKNGLDFKAIWNKIVEFLKKLPGAAQISTIILPISDLFKCIGTAKLKIFETILGIDCNHEKSNE